jgi:hypothetical protein
MDEINLSQVDPELYNEFSAEDREEAIHNLHRYLDVVVRINERLRAEDKLEETLRKSVERRKSVNK